MIKGLCHEKYKRFDITGYKMSIYFQAKQINKNLLHLIYHSLSKFAIII